MPHEVIMPALGMAQDSGLLVSWLKNAGDPVKAGDALMEVETDKATMEVEAAHDGYLTNLRAKAGEDVPVGQVVALISETPEDAADTGDSGDTKSSAPEASAAEPAPEDSALPEGRGVIMPALGMTQDSGLIVAWSKAPGDAVAADDVLLEVETDKSTMEVPAGFDGYLAAVLASAGEDVPVGEVIAVISAEKPEKTVERSRADGAAAAPKAAEKAPESEPKSNAKPAPDAKPDRKPRAAASAAAASGGRIFASPKLRRIAAEEGLDLGRLVAEGISQPFHMADLETLRALPAQTSPATAPQPGAVSQRLTAEIPGAPLAEFVAWLGTELSQPGTRAAALAAFAGAALAEATGQTGAIAVETAMPAASRRFAFAPGLPIGSTSETEDDCVAILRDLTATPITGLHLGADTAPVLSLTRRGDSLQVTYEGALPAPDAIAFVNGFAARLADPLRHIL